MIARLNHALVVTATAVPAALGTLITAALAVLGQAYPGAEYRLMTCVLKPTVGILTIADVDWAGSDTAEVDSYYELSGKDCLTRWTLATAVNAEAVTVFLGFANTIQSESDQ
jgi:hypothetical protein